MHEAQAFTGKGRYGSLEATFVPSVYNVWCELPESVICVSYNAYRTASAPCSTDILPNSKDISFSLKSACEMHPLPQSTD